MGEKEAVNEPKRKRRRWVTAFIGLVFVTSISVALWPRDGHLLARATRVVSIGSHPASYWWINEDEILILPSYDGDQELPSATEYVLPFEKPDINRVATRINVKTGKRLLVLKLTEALNKSTHGKYDHVNMDDVSLSPDGKQLLWFKFNSHAKGVYISGINGNNVRYWETPNSIGALWAADSRSFTALKTSNSQGDLVVTEYSLQNVIHSSKLPTTMRKDTENLFTFGFRDAALRGRYLITDTGTLHSVGHILFWPQTKPMIWQIPIGTVNKDTIKNPIRIQDREVIHTIVYSPAGDRAALIVTGELRPPLPEFVYRMLPKLRPEPQDTMTLWVTDIDGSGMHKIGWESIVWETRYWPDLLRWTPDGKRLSFIHDGGLYTVPAD
jgi:hypothetical protein